MIISVTERGTYKRCRRQWNFGSFNRLGVTKRVPKTALALGGLIHKSHAEWKEQPDKHLKDLFMTNAGAKIKEIKTTYAKEVGAPMNEAELYPLYEGIGLGMAMVTNYEDHWKTPLPPGFAIVAPEQTVVIDIPGTEHSCEVCDNGWKELRPHCTECNGTGVTMHKMEMTLDGIISDKKDRLFVLEHKTYGQRPKLEHLQMNDQFLAYYWGLSKLNLGKVGGVAYDGMWKKEAPPRGKTLADLFLRTLIQRPGEEVAEFETFLAMEANEMASNPPLFINRPWQGCYDCDYERLCSAISRGEDWEYILNTFYTERTKENQVNEVEDDVQG